VETADDEVMSVSPSYGSKTKEHTQNIDISSTVTEESYSMAVQNRQPRAKRVNVHNAKILPSLIRIV
jgi:hypothetical protein